MIITNVDGILAGENDILQIRLEFQHVHFQFRYNKCRFFTVPPDDVISNDDFRADILNPELEYRCTFCPFGPLTVMLNLRFWGRNNNRRTPEKKHLELTTRCTISMIEIRAVHDKCCQHKSGIKRIQQKKGLQKTFLDLSIIFCLAWQPNIELSHHLQGTTVSIFEGGVVRAFFSCLLFSDLGWCIHYDIGGVPDTSHWLDPTAGGDEELCNKYLWLSAVQIYKK